MRPRLVLAPVAIAIAAASIPAFGASTAKPQVTDPKGDANGLNGQGFVTGGPSVSTPSDDTGADITAVTFATTFKTVKGKKKPTGSTLTLTLAGPPTQPETEYRVSAKTSGCDDAFFELGTDAATKGSDARCPATPPAKEISYTIPKAAVKGNTIVWTLPLSIFPVGTTFASLVAETRFNPAVITAPVIDHAESKASFTVGY